MKWFIKFLNLVSLMRSYSKGDWESAIVRGKKIISIYPNSPRTMTTIAECYFYEQDYDSAVDFANRSLVLDPASMDSLKILIKSLYYCGDHASTYRYVIKYLASWREHHDKSIPDIVSDEGLASMNGAPFAEQLGNKLENIYKAEIDESLEFLEWAANFKERYERKEGFDSPQ